MRVERQRNERIVKAGKMEATFGEWRNGELFFREILMIIIKREKGEMGSWNVKKMVEMEGNKQLKYAENALLDTLWH